MASHRTCSSSMIRVFFYWNSRRKYLMRRYPKNPNDILSPSPTICMKANANPDRKLHHSPQQIDFMRKLSCVMHTWLNVCTLHSAPSVSRHLLAVLTFHRPCSMDMLEKMSHILLASISQMALTETSVRTTTAQNPPTSFAASEVGSR